MKKLSLLLALLLVVSCFVLASCGEEEESSVTETSSTAATSSEAASVVESSEAESSEAESSEEESSEEESSEPEYVKNPDALSTEGNNVAAGKTYTRSQLFRQGSADANYGWDENANIAYDDEGNVTLTDGVISAADAAYSDASWMGFHASCPDYTTNGGYAYVIVDLGESYELSELTLHVGTTFLGSGIGCPTSIEFLVSEDGETYYSAGVVNPANDETVASIPVTLECDVTGRYVQVRMTTPGWCFVNEFEAK